MVHGGVCGSQRKRGRLRNSRDFFYPERRIFVSKELSFRIKVVFPLFAYRRDALF